MRIIGPALLGIVAFASSTACFAESNWPTEQQPAAPGLSEGQKRRILAPSIRAASDCVAQKSLQDWRVVDAFRALNMQPVIDLAWGGCLNELGRVIVEHDRLHGPGTGLIFLRGPYKEDLPRAVNVRIRDEVNRRIAAADQIEAERRLQEAQAEAQRRQQEAQAAAERQRQLEFAEAQRKATLARLEKVAIDTRDNAYRCTDGELVKLVGSAEMAETLATAAMTGCRSEISNALEARIDVTKLSMATSATDTSVRSYREDLRKVMHDSVVTSAVQIKAALNTPAPVSTPSAPKTVPASVPAIPSPAFIAPAATPAGPAVAPAVTACLMTVNTAQKGKFVDRNGLIKAMLDLCRPEIESMARDRFLADMTVPLDRHREYAATATSGAATTIVDGQ